tara:strand:- start:560 stop:1315 length:756 start_codon:yes stop_codon:yes gene_type:complete
MSEWIINNKSQFIQSRLLLKNGFSHAFFTKKVNSNSPKDLISIFSSKHEIYLLKQIHSNIVENTSNIPIEKSIEADGLISEKSKQQSLWIYSADCIPILFADIRTGGVGACHAGWRGISKNIITNAIQKLIENGSEKEDLIVALGPAISILNYEVDYITASKVFSSLNTDKTSFRVRKDKSINLEAIKIDYKNRKLFLDIRIAATIQLKNAGFTKNQLSINNNCTFNEEYLFHSFRREKSKGRQWSVILSK